MRRAARTLIWLLDEMLDQIPAREDGRWYRYGQWGCTLRLSRWWAQDKVPRQAGRSSPGPR